MSLGRAKWQLNCEWRLKSRTKRARNARQGVQQVPGWQALSLPHALPLSQQSSLYSLSAALRSLFAYTRQHPVESHVAVALVQLGDTLVASEIASNLLHTKRGTRRYSAFGSRHSAVGIRVRLFALLVCVLPPSQSSFSLQFAQFASAAAQPLQSAQSTPCADNASL